MPTRQYACFRADTDWFGDWRPAPARQIFFFITLLIGDAALP
jgi:hypothetical protein